MKLKLFGPNRTDLKFARESYSQEGEDLMLMRYFHDKNDGFFVDIGAHHPFRFNNTYNLYKKGWRGVNIDLDFFSISLFNKYRSEDINIQSAVGKYSSGKTLYVFKEPALTTFNARIAKMYQKEGYKFRVKNFVKVEELSSVLNKAGVDRSIDLMNIDVEGLEYEVLTTNDWSKYRPRVIVVESLGLRGLKEINQNKIVKLLKAKKYAIFAINTSNIFFARK